MIYHCKTVVKQDTEDCVLREGKTGVFRFSGSDLDRKAHHRLYFTCEDRMYYGWKDEPQGDKLYMLIDDALDSEHADRSRYCLNLSSAAPKAYPRRALHKAVWPPKVGIYGVHGVTGDWTLGISACVNDLKLEKDGYLRLRLERWEKQPGIDPRMTAEEPSETILLDIPEGSYGYRTLQKEIVIPDSTACVMVTVEGEQYQGEVYLEAPFLRSCKGDNLLPEFDTAVPKVESFLWLGQNLSRKEWPEFRITLNGVSVYEGEVFLRIHRYAPVELDIPDEIPLGEENELSITYTSHYHDTVPVAIREIYLLERPRQLFSISSCPRNAVWGQDIPVLIRTEADGVALHCESEELEAVTPLVFEKKGLHTAVFRAKCQKNHLVLTLSGKEAGSGTEARIGETVRDSAEIEHMVQKETDGVICGSGDMIYIDNSSVSDVEGYLEWFLAGELGNLITVRPAYRWGGQRTANPKVWECFTRLCREMKLSYVHMTDGRDLPCIGHNPSCRDLAGEGFLGQQLHERDGQLFYWGYPTQATVPVNELFFDLAQRLGREFPDTTENEFMPGNLTVNEGQICLLRDVQCEADMRDAYEHALRSLRKIRRDYARHTGPSVMFKYFYQAGFSFAGAETMDSSMEILLSFLRGAAKAYGREQTGVHHALQWENYPHDIQQHYDRYLLALYTSYMHGVTQINTEEGFWHMEAFFTYFHRFSNACVMHREQEKRFYRYITSHSRTGQFYTPIAFLHGRYDGWNGFGGRWVFGMPQLPVGEAEDSWKLLKIFYPLNHISKNGTFAGGYVPDDTTEPCGFYSGTPEGVVDVVPVEQGNYDGYRLLCFAGYNAAAREDFDRLLAFVEEGGMLLMGWPHVSYTTRREDVEKYRHQYLPHPLTECLTSGVPVFEERTWKGKTVTVCVNPVSKAEVLERTDMLEPTDVGVPLVYSISRGKGRIIFVNCKAYPANPAIYPAYEKTIRSLAKKLRAEEPSEILCGEDVEYTEYVQEDGSRHYYLTPVDWYRDPKPVRTASLRIGEQILPLQLHFGVLMKLVVTENMAAWTEEETAEVLSVSKECITVQGVDTVHLKVARAGTVKQYELDFSEVPVQEIFI